MPRAALCWRTARFRIQFCFLPSPATAELASGWTAAGRPDFGCGYQLQRIRSNPHWRTAGGVAAGNGRYGVRVAAGAASTYVTDNINGLNPARTAAVPNGGPGVDADNAPNSGLGRQIGGFDIIAGTLAQVCAFPTRSGAWSTISTSTSPCVHGFALIPSVSDTSELSPLFTLWFPVTRR
jgi:hypothetical protein